MVMRTIAALFVLPIVAGSAFAGTEVSLATFKSVELDGGGQVTLRHGNVQRVTLVKGSTQITHFEIRNGNELKIDACTDKCPQHYDMQVEIVSPAIGGVAIHGGGAIKAVEAFPRQDTIGTAISGGGSIDIRNMPADNVSAAVNGGGRIRTAPLHMLQAAINGGGDIDYTGSPSVTSAVNGGGHVSKE